MIKIRDMYYYSHSIGFLKKMIKGGKLMNGYVRWIPSDGTPFPDHKTYFELWPNSEPYSFTDTRYGSAKAMLIGGKEHLVAEIMSEMAGTFKTVDFGEIIACEFESYVPVLYSKESCVGKIDIIALVKVPSEDPGIVRIKKAKREEAGQIKRALGKKNLRWF